MNPIFYHSALPDLEQRLQYDLDLLGLPEKPWMPQRTVHGRPLLDVAVIGGGMAGLTAAAALTFMGIGNIGVYDAAAAGAEGPWATHARMQTLRSPKELAGPALGIPSLTFRAWYTQQHGEAGWEELDRIPRLVWHAYLQWYRQVLGLPVHNLHRLERVSQVEATGIKGPIARLRFATGNGTAYREVYARHVVLATGLDGLGGPNILPGVAALDRRFWRHSSEAIDFAVLRDKTVAIIGGGDSALDAAATALEARAREVNVYVRSTGYTQINYWKAFTHAGHRYGYAALTPGERANVLGFLQAQRTPPARGTLQRLQSAENLLIHFGESLSGFHETHGQIAFTTRAGHAGSADFLVLATGYVTDPQRRPELAELVPHMRFFDAGALDGRLPLQGGVIPRLNGDFSFSARYADACALLAQVHCFTSQALLSLGKICGDIPGISAGAQKLAQGIAAKLYRAEHAWQCDTLRLYNELEVSDEALQALHARAAACPVS